MWEPKTVGDQSGSPRVSPIFRLRRSRCRRAWATLKMIGVVLALSSRWHLHNHTTPGNPVQTSTGPPIRPRSQDQAPSPMFGLEKHLPPLMAAKSGISAAATFIDSHFKRESYLVEMVVPRGGFANVR